jgi:hypothetical protein
VRTIEATVAAHESRNRGLLESLRTKGADLFEKRPIDLHFWATSNAGARGLAEALGRDGFGQVVVSGPSASVAKWNVDAQLKGSIMEVPAVSFVERYATLAAQHSAEFDGWGTSV